MTDSAEIATRNKKLIRETIAGYAAAAEIIERERIERLRRITIEESLADYVGLVGFHYALKRDSDDEGLRRLEQWRLREKIAMRQVFEAVARDLGCL